MLLLDIDVLRAGLGLELASVRSLTTNPSVHAAVSVSHPHSRLLGIVPLGLVLLSVAPTSRTPCILRSALSLSTHGGAAPYAYCCAGGG